jgi:pimeloyl-ACP methyl ester carboxylesterase
MAAARSTNGVTTADGVRLSVDRYDTGSDRAIVICPGFFQSKDTRTFQRMAEQLTDPWDVVAFDFRGHGRSSGLYAFSARETADLSAVLAWVRPQYRSLGVMGLSLGGAISILTLAREPRQVRSLLAVSAPSAFEQIEFQWWTPEACRTGLRGLELGAGCRPAWPWSTKERPVDRIAALRPMPVHFVHGTRDVIVGHPHSERLHAAAAGPKRLTILPGASHAEAIYRDEPAGFLRIVRGWFGETLAGA